MRAQRRSGGGDGERAQQRRQDDCSTAEVEQSSWCGAIAQSRTTVWGRTQRKHGREARGSGDRAGGRRRPRRCWGGGRGDKEARGPAQGRLLPLWGLWGWLYGVRLPYYLLDLLSS
ncbi:hypothetical protein PLESTB_001554900 [Pleodorina starrii]|uniref:Uncharacterized protein n=1 Tax=Pleodorina starrii TaxID=330485 RepID=A0A9W6BX76_9CHLO|nr:hypothetical protein PLESTB_001554900 [Pleodorina starrii]